MRARWSNGLLQKPRAPRETSKLSDDAWNNDKVSFGSHLQPWQARHLSESRDDVARPVNTAWYLLEVLIWGVRMRDIPSWVLVVKIFMMSKWRFRRQLLTCQHFLESPESFEEFGWRRFPLVSLGVVRLLCCCWSKRHSSSSLYQCSHVIYLVASGRLNVIRARNGKKD